MGALISLVSTTVMQVTKAGFPLFDLCTELMIWVALFFYTIGSPKLNWNKSDRCMEHIFTYRDTVQTMEG